MKRLQAETRFDEVLIGSYIFALFAGLIMVYSASSLMAESRFNSHWFFLRHQFFWTVISAAAVFFLARLDLRKWAVLSIPATAVIMVMLALVFLMPARNEAQRWLFLGPITVQPSELFKFVMIVAISYLLSRPGKDITNLRELLLPCVPPLLLALALIVKQPDLGTAIVILITAMGLFFLAGARVKHLGMVIVPSIIGAAYLVLVHGYKKARVLDYMNALWDPLQGSYQVKQAALTIGSGGIFGMGLGDGRQKLFFLPYPHTDFIFASTAEEFGFLGSVLLVALLALILWRGSRIAMRQPDKFGFLLAAGMTWSLFINIAINLGVVTSLLPVTGLPLPFFSYGGSSLLISSAAIGVLINLSRRVKA